MKKITLLLLMGTGLVGFGQTPNLHKPVQVDIFVPAGMPITVEVKLDNKETTVNKYNILRHVTSDVDRVKMVVLLVGPDNKLHPSSRSEIAENEAWITTNRAYEPASVAWAPEKVDVRRLILIVERVETDEGVWVLDTQGQSVDFRAVIERGKEALPQARFLSRK